jgi:hypothetical protein
MSDAIPVVVPVAVAAQAREAAQWTEERKRRLVDACLEAQGRGVFTDSGFTAVLPTTQQAATGLAVTALPTTHAAANSTPTLPRVPTVPVTGASTGPHGKPKRKLADVCQEMCEMQTQQLNAQRLAEDKESELVVSLKMIDEVKEQMNLSVLDEMRVKKRMGDTPSNAVVFCSLVTDEQKEAFLRILLE